MKKKGERGVALLPRFSTRAGRIYRGFPWQKSMDRTTEGLLEGGTPARGNERRPRQGDCKTRVMRPSAPALFDSLDGAAAPAPTTRQSGNGGKMAPKFHGTGAGVLLNSKNWRQSVPGEREVPLEG